MEMTGERFIATFDEPDINYEHWHRYLYARSFVAGKVVLDIASGDGYGSFLLASSGASRVTGVDIALEAVQHARKNYRLPHLEYLVGSVAAIPVAAASIDVLVSFETIEHVDETQQRLFLAEIERVLKPDGLLVLSTPNKRAYSDQPGYSNPYHFREFYIEEFLEFLRPKFRSIELLGQRIFASSYIWVPGTDSRECVEYQIRPTEQGFVVAEDTHKEMLYAIALCTNGVPPKGSASLLVDPEDSMITRKNGLIEQQKEHIKRQQEHMVLQEQELGRLNQALLDAQAHSEALSAQRQEEFARFSQLLRDAQTHSEALIAQRQEEFARFSQLLCDNQAHIGDLTDQVRSRSPRFWLHQAGVLGRSAVAACVALARLAVTNPGQLLSRLKQLRQTGLRALLAETLDQGRASYPYQ